MKQIKNRIAFAALVVVLFVVSLFSAGIIKTQPVNAQSSDYNNEDIYYIYDLYPTLTKEMIEDNSQYTIFFDYIDADYGHFDAIMPGYLAGFEGKCVVFDIKTFVPDLENLIPLFEIFQANNCKIVYFTSYAKSAVSNSDVLDEYDDYSLYNVSADKFRLFLREVLDSVIDFYSISDEDGNPCLSDICIFLDGLVDIYSVTAQNVCQVALETPRARYLLEELASLFGISGSLDDSQTLSSLIAALDDNNIRLLSYSESLGTFVDLVSSATYSYDEIYYYQDNNFGRLQTQYACAIGISELHQGFYNTMYDLQQDYGIPVYLFEADPIVFGPDGLVVLTDGNVLDGVYSAPDASAADIAAEILNLLN